LIKICFEFAPGSIGIVELPLGSGPDVVVAAAVVGAGVGSRCDSRMSLVLVQECGLGPFVWWVAEAH
jgi:hypothetical protein